MTRGAKQVVKCKCCKVEFETRVADIKRGWGKYCSKSCKAIKQEQRTGQMRNYLLNSSSNKGGYWTWEGQIDRSADSEREDLKDYA